MTNPCAINSGEAIRIHESGVWTSMADREKVLFQLSHETLCMPFGVFSRAVSKVLGRPVYSHEFAQPKLLLLELFKLEEAPKSTFGRFAQIYQMMRSGL